MSFVNHISCFSETAKTLVVIAFFSITSNYSIAQDIIHFRNGSTLEAKVLEISDSKVEYVKIANIDGPHYSVSKTEIVKIIYNNGTMDEFIKPVNTDNYGYVSTSNSGAHQNDRKLMQDSMLAKRHQCISVNVFDLYLSRATVIYEWMLPSNYFGLTLSGSYGLNSSENFNTNMFENSLVTNKVFAFGSGVRWYLNNAKNKFFISPQYEIAQALYEKTVVIPYTVGYGYSQTTQYLTKTSIERYYSHSFSLDFGMRFELYNSISSNIFVGIGSKNVKRRAYLEYGNSFNNSPKYINYQQLFLKLGICFGIKY